jgi:ribosomal protein S18 acetylase RimI-like enzyme
VAGGRQDGLVTTVRRLHAEQRDAALATVVAAFRTDPLLRWWFPDDATYDALASRFFGVLLDTRLDGGEVWVVDFSGDTGDMADRGGTREGAGDGTGGTGGTGGGSGVVGAVSMWVPPGGNLLGPDIASERYCEVVGGLPAQSAERIVVTDEAVDALIPVDPHWYLGVLATHPDHRGCGLGTAVCEPVFAAADRAGVPIVLETANPLNVGYYTRRGFAVLRQAALDPGPAAANGRAEPLTMRIMFRAPRGDSLR